MDQKRIYETIINHTREVIPTLEDHFFKEDDALKELGANSIDRSEIVMMTLESLSMNMPLVDTAGAQNIGELADIIYAKSQTI